MARSPVSVLLCLAAALPSPTTPLGRLDEGCEEARRLADDARSEEDPVAALVLLLEAQELCPTAEPLFELALASERLGRLDDAVEHYELALARDSAHPGARFRLARLLDQLGDTEPARRHYAAFLEAAEGEADLRHSVSGARGRLAELSRADAASAPPQPAAASAPRDGAAPAVDPERLRPPLEEMAARAAERGSEADSELALRLLFTAGILSSERRAARPDDLVVGLAAVQLARDLAARLGFGERFEEALPAWNLERPDAILDAFLADRGYGHPAAPPEGGGGSTAARIGPVGGHATIRRGELAYQVARLPGGLRAQVSRGDGSWTTFELDSNYRTVVVEAGNRATSYRSDTPFEIGVQMASLRDEIWLDRVAAAALAGGSRFTDREVVKGRAERGTGKVSGTVEATYDYRKLGTERRPVVLGGASVEVDVWRIAYRRTHAVRGTQEMPEIRIGSVRRASPLSGPFETRHVAQGTLWVADDPAAPLILEKDVELEMQSRMPSVPPVSNTVSMAWKTTEVSR